MTPLDPQMVLLFALTTSAGYLMMLSGVGKGMLVWKRRTQMPVVRPAALLLLRLARRALLSELLGDLPRGSP